MSELLLHGRAVTDIEIDGVDTRDYPDFCDAFISAARYEDTGAALTDEELDELHEAGGDVYASELAAEWCMGG